jgi:hypothetical protein
VGLEALYLIHDDDDDTVYRYQHGPNAMKAVPRQMDVRLNRAGGQIPVLRTTLLVLVANSNYATRVSIVWELVFIRLSCADQAHTRFTKLS